METNNDLIRVLTREGVLINASVRYWRGCLKLKPEDIGLDADALSKRLISLGHKRLLPKEATAELTLVEGRVHALIEANTFPFLNGLAHFLPNAKLGEMTGKLKDLESEYWLAQHQFLADYARLRAEATIEWRAMAEKLVADPERLLATIEAAFPLPEKMAKHFSFDVQLFQISLPESLALELVSTEEQQGVIQARQRAVEEAGNKIRRDTEAFVADCIASLREQTAQLCDEMLHSINSCQTGVHQKTLNRLINFIDQFKEMNFANDTVMAEQLNTIRQDLLSRTAKEYRDNDFARNRLVDSLHQLSNTAKEMAKQDATELVQRFGELGRRKFNLAA